MCLLMSCLDIQARLIHGKYPHAVMSQSLIRLLRLVVQLIQTQYLGSGIIQHYGPNDLDSDRPRWFLFTWLGYGS